MIKKVINFITTDIWRIRVKSLTRTKSILLKPLMIMLLAFRSFNEDKCQLRASALTYYSLLSVVPVVAMAFGIAKGFGFETVLEKLLFEKMPGQEEVVTQIINFSRAMLENTKGGMIAGIGVAVLFWTVIKVLGNIEKSFNDIWGIKQARRMGRKFSDYLSIMLICPLLFIIASSVTVIISTQVKLIVEKIFFLGVFSPLILLSLKLMPFAVIWILFSFIYIFLPNTQVYLKSGIVGGVVAGTLYQVVQWAYINFQVGVAKYNAIYGSFAALPLFLIWLQLSWLIVLFGAEISFARQNLETYEFEPDCLRVSYNFKKLLTLRIASLLVKNFCKAAPALTAANISHELEMPIRLVNQILFELVESGILSETKDPKTQARAYQPGRSVDDLKIKDVVDLLEHHGTNNIPVVDSEALKKLEASLKSFAQEIANSKANILIKNV